MDASAIKLVLIVGFVLVLAVREGPSLIEDMKSLFKKLLAWMLPWKEERLEERRMGKRLGRAGILRGAALVIVAMIVYMPSYKSNGQLRFDFAYRFIWEIGEVPGSFLAIEPAILMLLGQTAVVMCIAGLLVFAASSEP